MPKLSADSFALVGQPHIDTLEQKDFLLSATNAGQYFLRFAVAMGFGKEVVLNKAARHGKADDVPAAFGDADAAIRNGFFQRREEGIARFVRPKQRGRSHTFGV